MIEMRWPRKVTWQHKKYLLMEVIGEKDFPWVIPIINGIFDGKNVWKKGRSCLDDV